MTFTYVFLRITYECSAACSRPPSLGRISNNLSSLRPTNGHRGHSENKENDNSNSDPNAGIVAVFKLAATIEETAGIRSAIGNFTQNSLEQVIIDVQNIPDIGQHIALRRAVITVLAGAVACEVIAVVAETAQVLHRGIGAQEMIVLILLVFILVLLLVQPASLEIWVHRQSNVIDWQMEMNVPALRNALEQFTDCYIRDVGRNTHV